MIVSFLNFEEAQRTVLLVVLERENVERMRKADPVTLESEQNGGLLKAPLYPQNMSVLIAYEEEEVDLYRMARSGDAMGLVQYLERGRRWNEATDGKKNSAVLYSSKATAE